MIVVSYLLVYMLKSAVVLALLTALYRFTLRRETFHRFNRAVLLGIGALSLALPALTLQAPAPMAVNVAVAEVEQWLAPVSAPAGEGALTAAPPAFEWASARGVACIYAAGMAVAALRLLFGYASLVRLFRGSRRVERSGGLSVFINDALSAPVSWFGNILISSADYRDNAAALLAHEAAHAHCHHTLDLLFAELLEVLQWFNPAVYAWKDNLRAVHEFSADRAAAAPGVAGEAYQLMLIKKAASRPAVAAVVNSFNACSVNSRLAMMYAAPSGTRAMLKAALLVPVAAVAAAAFARPAMVADVVNARPAETSSIPVGEAPHEVGGAAEADVWEHSTGVAAGEVAPDEEFAFYLNGRRVSRAEAMRFLHYRYDAEKRVQRYALRKSSGLNAMSIGPTADGSYEVRLW